MKRNRIISQAYGPMRNLRISPDEQVPLASSNVAGGMIDEVSPSALQDNQLVVAKNVVIRSDRVRRRPSTSLFTPAKPNSRKVISLMEFKRNDGQNNFLRFTRDSIHYTTSGAWVSIVAGGGAPALAGLDTDKWRTVVIEDRLFAANNGKNVILEIDPVTNTYDVAGNADQYKFITGFSNRLVAAFLSGSAPEPIRIAWSGDRNYTEFDAAVDISAGTTPLVESSADVTDNISGIFGFSNLMFIPRERSLWLATKQASASNPFFFGTDISGVGCATPDAISRVFGGIVFPDFRQQDIYNYTGPKELKSLASGKIRRSIFSGISDISSIYSSFDSVSLEWTLFIPSADESYVTMWRYNFRKEAWTYDEYALISCVGDVDRSASSISIDDLSGTMDGLVGSFNDLSDPGATPPQRLLGRFDGEILTVVDGSNLVDYGDVAFDSVIESKVFEEKTDKKLLFQEQYFTIYTDTIGSILLEYSKNEGKTWNTAKTFTIDSSRLGEPTKLKWKRPRTLESYQWRLTSTDCNFELLDYTIMVETTGEKKQSSGVT